MDTLTATDVVFRIDNTGEVTAVFSDLTCYAHVGQHATCTRQWLRNTKPATEAQYADLKRELESAPYSYSLRVCKRLKK